MNKIHIFLISGRMQSGKDTAADFIDRWLPDSTYYKRRYAFATGVKEFALNNFPTLITEENLIVKTEASREILQAIGNGIRNELDPNVWAQREYTRALSDIERFISSGDLREFVGVFTDVRYPNEYNKIFSLKHTLKASYGLDVKIHGIRITRDDSDLSSHESETSMDTFAHPTLMRYSNNNSLQEYSEDIKKWIKERMK